MGKTLLLLGGSQQQEVAIKTAQRMGIRTVLCDYLPDNPGRENADSYYPVSTTDKEKVLEVAVQERIDGILAYASDPAAPTAAYVAEKLSLPGIPYEMALNFCEKNRFRAFLKENAFNYPKMKTISGDESIDGITIDEAMLPFIVKPSDASGSKGVTVVHEIEKLKTAIEFARSNSRNGTIVIEKFIQRDHMHVIEAELVIADGKIITWGLINSIRDEEINPLLPAAYSYPLELEEDRIALVKREVERLIQTSGMQAGAFNIEMIITGDNQLYFIDAGPRCGGNMLPDFISLIAGDSVIEAIIKIALGEAPNSSIKLDGRSGGFWGLTVLHSPKAGRLQDIKYSPNYSANILANYVFVQPGELVKPFDNSRALLGLTILQFSSRQSAESIMNQLSKHIIISVDDIN